MIGNGYSSIYLRIRAYFLFKIMIVDFEINLRLNWLMIIKINNIKIIYIGCAVFGVKVYGWYFFF